MSFRIGDIETRQREKATGYVKLAEQAVGVRAARDWFFTYLMNTGDIVE